MESEKAPSFFFFSPAMAAYAVQPAAALHYLSVGRERTRQGAEVSNLLAWHGLAVGIGTGW